MQSYECVTGIHIEHHNFELKWQIHREVIENLKNEKCGERRSTVFQEKFHNSFWFIKLKKSSEQPDYLGMFVCLKKSSRPFLVRYTDILKTYNTKGCTDLRKDEKKYGWDTSVTNSWGRKMWIHQQELDKDQYWFNDYMTIVVQIEVKVSGEEVTTMKQLMPVNHPPLDEDFMNLLQSEIHSDVTFIVCNRQIKAHRCILAARCDYFKSMFAHNFIEAGEYEVKIPDTDPATFESILKYIYTNKTPEDFQGLALKLMVAADKYRLEKLAQVCENHLCKNICMDNYIELLVYADSCSRRVLLEHVKTFIKNNYVTIIASDAWKKLQAEKLSLAYRTVEAINII